MKPKVKKHNLCDKVVNKEVPVKLSQKEKEKKYIVEFNRKLSTKFYEARLNNEEISNPNHFLAQQCFFNFHDDRIEYFLKIHYALAQRIGVRTKQIRFITSGKPALILPIVLDDSKREDNFIILMIHANFKDHLLDLFSFHTKTFKLVINYNIENDQKYTASFITPLPQLNDQDDFKPKKKFTKICMPEEFPFGKEMTRLFQNKFQLTSDARSSEMALHRELFNYANADDDEKFQSDNFWQMLQYMMVIEDLDCLKQTEDYNLRFQKVFSYRHCRLSLRQVIDRHLKYLMCEKKRSIMMNSIFVIEATQKMPVDAMEFDYVYITDMYDYQQYIDDLSELKAFRIVAKIAYIFDNLILIKIAPARTRRQRADPPKIDSDRPYHIEFIPNRMSTRVAHRALEDLKSADMLDYLKRFEKPNASARKHDENFDDFEWFNESIKDNEEQQIAIQNIVNCTSFPSPYCLFGGPGTGKSSTLVEAISQIVKLKPKSHILITSSSNSACDDIGNRLLQYVSKNKILRIYSPSFDNKPDKLDSVLQETSNFRNRSLCNCNKRSCPETEPLDDPTYDEFYTARVVLATLVSCGRIVSAGIEPNHFDYIFIDEAASECEQRTLIPISGLGISLNKVNAQIVLSGDHKQLGAIVANSFARKMGMEMSLMERLMLTDDKYECIDGEYDFDYCTQLKQNYRNHPAIMHFSNENFYNSQLVSTCSEEIINFSKDSELLMFNVDFPIIFHTIKTPSKEVGTSLKNDAECAILGYYLNAILRRGVNGNKVEQKDIGIISPYRGQRDLIVESYHQANPEIEIGTVDAFQGREKKIIILSCVRSQTKHLGFLRNEKRLNVALTRAKALLIIIGNAETLQKCSMWNKFISYCFENRGIVGDILSVNYSAAVDETKAEKQEDIPDGKEDEYDG